MKNEKGVTLATVILIVVVMVIIAATSIVVGNRLILDAKEQKKEENYKAVVAAVGREFTKMNTAGTITPGYYDYVGTRNPIIGRDDSGNPIEAGEDWYLLNENDLRNLGVKGISESYLVNYKDQIIFSTDDYEKTIFYMSKTGELELGDYINYTYDDAENYIVSGYASGYKVDGAPSTQEIAQKKDYTWRILSINDDGSIDLTATIVSSSPKIRFYGATGYNNGVFLLDDICEKHYSNQSLGVVARSIKIEDIEKNLNEDGITARDNYVSRGIKNGEVFRYSGTVTYPLLLEKQKGMGITNSSINTNGISRSDKYYSSYTEINSAKDQVKTTQNGLTLTLNTLPFTVEDLRTYLLNDGIADTIIGPRQSFWFATRGCSNYSSGCPYLGISLYSSGVGMTVATLYTNTDGASGSTNNIIRPVVNIPASFIIDYSDTSRDGSTVAKAWNLIK